MRLAFRLLVVLALGASLVAVQRRVDAVRETLPPQPSTLYLSSGKWVKRLTFGYDGLLACLYWTRAVQHYGSEKLGLQRYHLLAELLDITTTLDPDLGLAYRYGAIFLSARPPDGPGEVEAAIRLIEKGMARRPGDWGLWFDLGFLYYREREDYPKAAATLREGSNIPGAPSWLEVLATRIETEGGGREAAIAMWAQLYESTDDPGIRGAALTHLMGLRAEADAEALEGIVMAHRKASGQLPRDWKELMEAGRLRGIPLDPAGFAYLLGEDGRVYLHPDSTVVNPELRRPQ